MKTFFIEVAKILWAASTILVGMGLIVKLVEGCGEAWTRGCRKA